MQEGQPVVVVLEVERSAHAGGHLVQEAEHALVVTAAQAHLVEIEAEGLTLTSLDLDLIRFVISFNLENEVLLRTGHLEIDQVANVGLVDAQDSIPVAKSGSFGERARLDGLHRDHSSSSPASGGDRTAKRRVLAVTCRISTADDSRPRALSWRARSKAPAVECT